MTGKATNNPRRVSKRVINKDKEYDDDNTRKKEPIYDKMMVNQMANNL